MKTSIIIPVYNEKNMIIQLIDRVKSLPIPKEIIVVDDGSNDGTKEILEKLKSQNSNLKFIYHNKNCGKGVAIRTGLRYVNGNVVIIQDADFEYSPEEITQLVDKIKEGYPVVYGSRFKGKGKFIFSSLIANKFLTFLTNLLYNARLTDMETCYKCIRIELIKELDLKAKRFDLEPEITAKLLRKGYKIYEVPISYQGRKIGKKMSIKDGMQAIFTLIKWRLN